MQIKEKLYVGLDLHSNNSYLAIVDQKGKRVFNKRVVNDLDMIFAAIKPFKKNISDITVESTYNWYWLVDGLMEEGYRVHLANPNAIKQYSGKKFVDDKHDAFFLAELLRLGILPEGYIYPKEKRPLRDLLRRRMTFVQNKTEFTLGLKSMIVRNTGNAMSTKQVHAMTETEVKELFPDPALELAANSNMDIIALLDNKIKILEKHINADPYVKENTGMLKTIPGVGIILSLTIALETGAISRFKEVGNYSSYCRCVESKCTSNNKKKGENNRKNGNKYLAWAYVEAANFAIRYYPEINAYYQKKAKKTCRVVALKTVAHKLARAAYFVMRDRASFVMEKAFALQIK